jgi:signal transduction histidine kinase
MLGVDVDLSEVKQLEQENLKMRLQQQQQLLNAILDAQEEERRRISESLHNGVGQILFAAQLSLARVDVNARPERKPEVAQALDKARQLLTEAMVDTRRASHELVPILLKDYGLLKAMEEFCSRFERTGIKLECHCFPERLPAPLEMALYRISQELVNNIFKHSGATRAVLEVSKDRNFIYLEAQDNGKGIDTGCLKDPAPGKGIGMRTMQDRVDLLGGRLEIDATPGKGTLVSIRVPLRP